MDKSKGKNDKEDFCVCGIMWKVCREVKLKWNNVMLSKGETKMEQCYAIKRWNADVLWNNFDV